MDSSVTMCTHAAVTSRRSLQCITDALVTLRLHDAIAVAPQLAMHRRFVGRNVRTRCDDNRTADASVAMRAQV